MQRTSSIELKWAIDQLLALGYLETSGPEHVCLTGSGIKKGSEISFSLPVQDRVLLFLYHGELITGGEHE